MRSLARSTLWTRRPRRSPSETLGTPESLYRPGTRTRRRRRRPPGTRSPREASKRRAREPEAGSGPWRRRRSRRARRAASRWSTPPPSPATRSRSPRPRTDLAEAGPAPAPGGSRTARARARRRSHRSSPDRRDAHPHQLRTLRARSWEPSISASNPLHRLGRGRRCPESVPKLLRPSARTPFTLQLLRPSARIPFTLQVLWMNHGSRTGAARRPPRGSQSSCRAPRRSRRRSPLA
mmetsp:Transcript_88221/g.263033  ORF Transcript_88221/g.263033 Transcript_88221/m.263033 type:complete len:236 (+) Transcript_88221:1452-2159(+)